MSVNTGRNLQQAKDAIPEAARSLQKNAPEPPSTPETSVSGVASGLEEANNAVNEIPTTGMSPQEIVTAPTGDLIQVGTNAIGTDGSIMAGLPAANATGVTYTTTGVAGGNGNRCGRGGSGLERVHGSGFRHLPRRTDCSIYTCSYSLVSNSGNLLVGREYAKKYSRG